LIIMILLLSVLILVHELGHLIAARSFGIKVERFGIGLPFGPTLFEKQCGDIKILVHAFLFGGYVSFPDDDKESGIPKDSQDRFLNRPAYQRFVVFIAGVAANLLAAFVFVFIAASIWGHLPSGSYKTYVNKIVAPKEASVWQSGMQNGDRLHAINGVAVNSKYTVYLFAGNSKLNDGAADRKFIEDNYARLKSANPAYSRTEIIPEGVLIKIPPKLDEPPVQLGENVLKGIELYSADEANLSVKQVGLRDSIQGKTFIISDGTLTLDDLSYAISDGRKPLSITVEREGQYIELAPIYPDKEGLIGIMPNIKEDLIDTKSFTSVISQSIKYTYDQTRDILLVLKQLVTGKIPAKNLHGVVLVTKLGGDMISNEGLFSGLLLTAVISLNLVIFNLLPIPALDGGQILFLLIEIIRGKPLKEETIEKISAIFFLLLILLMILVTFNDILFLVKN